MSSVLLLRTTIHIAIFVLKNSIKVINNMQGYKNSVSRHKVNQRSMNLSITDSNTGHKTIIWQSRLYNRTTENYNMSIYDI